LKPWAALGALPVLAAAAAGWCLWRQCRGAVVGVVTASAVVLTGVLAAWGSAAVEAHKASRPLAQVIRAPEAEPDIRVGCYQYFQPSLVFYCGREVVQIENPRQALDHLRGPLPAYLLVPADEWENNLRPRLHEPHRVVGRHRDLYRGCDVVVVTNR
jgi:hypothetical protein